MVTVMAFFAATVFKNTHSESLDAPHHAVQLKHPSFTEAAPFLLFLFLLGCELFLKVTHDRQVRSRSCARSLTACRHMDLICSPQIRTPCF